MVLPRLGSSSHPAALFDNEATHLGLVESFWNWQNSSWSQPCRDRQAEPMSKNPWAGPCQDLELGLAKGVPAARRGGVGV